MRYFGWLFCLVLFCTLLCFLLVSFMSCSSEGKPGKHPSANQFLLHTFLWTGMVYSFSKVLLCCVSLVDFATRQLFKPLSNGLYTQLTAFSSYQSSIGLSQRHFIFSLCLLFFLFHACLPFFLKFFLNASNIQMKYSVIHFCRSIQIFLVDLFFSQKNPDFPHDQAMSSCHVPGWREMDRS